MALQVNKAYNISHILAHIFSKKFIEQNNADKNFFNFAFYISYSAKIDMFY